MPIITGCMRPTETTFLPALAGITPPDIRREARVAKITATAKNNPDRLLQHKATAADAACQQIGEGGHVRTVKVKRPVAREQCTPGLWYFAFRMSKHISLWNACYKSIVSTRNKKYLAKCKSMFLCGHAPHHCGHAPWCGACPHTECGHALYVYFWERDKLPGASCYLRICVDPTTILLILLLLLCVLVWFMAYLWVI